LSVKIEFRHAKEDFFKVTTKIGTYERQVQHLGTQHVDRQLAKLGLDPKKTVTEIINAYLKWHNGRRKQK